MKKRMKKIIISIVGLFVLLCIVIGIIGYVFGYLPYTRIRAKGEAFIAKAKTLSATFKQNDIDLLKNEVIVVKKSYEELKKESRSVMWMKAIPFVGNYIKDFERAFNAGDYLLKTGELAIEAILPYADLIGFKKTDKKDGESFFDKSADNRIETVVLTLDKMLIKIDEIASNIDKAQENIDAIDENRYPEKIGNLLVREQIRNGKQQFDGIASLFVDAKPLLKNLPEILGSKGEKTYLFLFQNDKELRPTGGFLTAYAVFKIKNGRFNTVLSSDIYNLDASIGVHPPAPEEILAYHKGVNRFYIRDSNLSPDLVESVKLFNSLYEESDQRKDYDGIFFVDTHVLVDVLDILGDTYVSNILFTAKEDKRCDCPQVIYELLDQIDRPVGYIKENRKGLIGEMLYVLMQKALNSSPSRYWGRIMQSMIKNFQERHILAYMKDKDIQGALEKMKFAGRIEQYDADYLHINDTNFAGAKSNLFVNHTILSESKIMDGKVKRTVTITYKNPYPASDCNLERGGLCLNATLRNWLRIYVPKGSKLISFTGSETKTKTYDELGKTVFEGFMRVNPMGKAEVKLVYEVPWKATEKYSLYIQKQAGTSGHDYTIKVNGKNIKQEKLIQDMLIKM